MKVRTFAWLLLLGLVGVSSLGRASTAVSEEAAASAVFGLPEFVALQKQYARRPQDLIVDYEGLSHCSSAKTSGLVWTLGIYLTAADADHGWPWAFFAVDARTGEILVREPDWSRKEPDAFVYLSLAEWRHRRGPLNQSSPGTAPVPTR